MSSIQKLTEDEQDLALQVNSFLMAVHLRDTAAIDDILSAAGDECGHVMLGAVLWLKESLDEVFEVLNESEDTDLHFTFDEMIQCSASSVLKNSPESC